MFRLTSRETARPLSPPGPLMRCHAASAASRLIGSRRRPRNSHSGATLLLSWLMRVSEGISRMCDAEDSRRSSSLSEVLVKELPLDGGRQPAVDRTNLDVRTDMRPAPNKPRGGPVCNQSWRSAPWSPLVGAGIPQIGLGSLCRWPRIESVVMIRIGKGSVPRANQSGQTSVLMLPFIAVSEARSLWGMISPRWGEEKRRSPMTSLSLRQEPCPDRAPARALTVP